MGGPKASRAMRTISMARTTPAQNPRGLSKSRVFWLSDKFSSFSLDALRIHLSLNGICKKATGKYLPGQRKPKKCWELAARGENVGVNGMTAQSYAIPGFICGTLRNAL